MLTRLANKQLLKFLSFSRCFANDPKEDQSVKKVPINPADYSLKKKKVVLTPEKLKELKEQQKKQIGLYRADKKVEYEWINPTPEDTGLNPEYEKVDGRIIRIFKNDSVPELHSHSYTM